MRTSALLANLHSNESGNPAQKNRTASRARADDRVHGYLLLTASRCGIGDELSCARVLKRLPDSPREREALRRTLFPFRMNEFSFRTMVAFCGQDPRHLTAADVAIEGGLPLASVATLLDSAVQKRWIGQVRSKGDGAPPRWALTEEGRWVTAYAIYRYLMKLAELGATVPGQRM